MYREQENSHLEWPDHTTLFLQVLLFNPTSHGLPCEHFSFKTQLKFCLFFEGFELRRVKCYISIIVSMLQALNGEHLMCLFPFCSYYWFGIYIFVFCFFLLITIKCLTCVPHLTRCNINQYSYSLEQYMVLRLL